MIPLTMMAAIILFCWVDVRDYQGVLVFDIFYGFIMAAGQGYDNIFFKFSDQVELTSIQNVASFTRKSDGGSVENGC